MRQGPDASDQTQRMTRPAQGGETAIVPAPVMGYPPPAPHRDPVPAEDDYYDDEDYEQGYNQGHDPDYNHDYEQDYDDYYDDYYDDETHEAYEAYGSESPSPSSPLGGRKAMLVGGALAGTLLVGALLFAGMAATHNSPAKQTSTGKPTDAKTSPSATPASASAKAHTKVRSNQATTSANVIPNIDDARSDPRPLTLTEVFPDSEIIMAGRPYRQTETSVSGDCALAAHGAMVAALRHDHCASVVRAAYLDEGGKYAVTMGIAVFPTKAQAVTASTAGDPSAYQWFTSMGGTARGNVGGYSASTALGRYLVYSYVESADGTPANVANPTLQAVATAALDYAGHPIRQRATG